MRVRFITALVFAATLVTSPAQATEVTYALHAVSNDPYYTGPNLWNMHGDLLTSNKNAFGSQADEAWNANYTGSGTVVIGLLDGGVQVNHPDLSQNIWVNPGEVAGDGLDNDNNGYADDINGWNFDANSGTFPAESHGTHVSGIMGAKGGNGTGVAGVNWDVRIAVAKVTGRNGIFDSTVIRAIDYFIALKKAGVNVVALNASWGSPSYSQALSDAINRAGDAGIIFVASAGNANINNDTTPNYPSSFNCSFRYDTKAARGYDCILAVAGLNSSGTAPYNYGATSVDIAAPGASINSTLPNSSYGSMSGTSMAAPHVTGAVALCYSINPSITPGQVIGAILGSSTSTPSLLGRVVTGGRLNIGDMVARCKNPGADMTGSPSNLSGSVVSDTTVSLAWTDGAVGELSYVVERGVTCDALSTVATLAPNSKAHTVTGLAASTSYCFRVRAVSAALSASSNLVTVRTPATVAPPAAFTKTSPGTGTRPYGPGVNLRWAASTNVTRYEYCIATTAAGCTNWVSTGMNTYAILTLRLNIVYYWQVRAVGLGGTTYADSGTLWYFVAR